MFTGLVDHFSSIFEISVSHHAHRLWVESDFIQLEPGESIAIDGLCVTVIEAESGKFSCDLSPETLRVTLASSYRRGARVNLERALLPTSRLGGHFVTGHIDQVGVITSIQDAGEFIEMQVGGLTPGARKLMVQKGSIAVNGVSLTVNSLTPDGFNVMLIPHTLQRTNLQFLSQHDPVNLEFDMMAKLIAEQYQHYVSRP
jgi:riboflavin synthase